MPSCCETGGARIIVFNVSGIIKLESPIIVRAPYVTIAGQTATARIGRDMRNALYGKSLDFSIHDFDQYGTGSMITRMLSDVSVIQQAVVWCVTMVLPVPALSLMGIAMAFSIDQIGRASCRERV